MAIENCAFSSEEASKSNVYISGLPAVVSVNAIAAQPPVFVGYIAAAGTHIDCLPIAAFTNVPAETSIPAPSIASAIKATSPFLSVPPSDIKSSSVNASPEAKSV